MTEFWVSQGKKWCDICRCWYAGTRRATIRHEEGKQHQEKLKEWLKTKRQNEKNKAFDEEEIKRIERVAHAQIEKDAVLFQKPGSALVPNIAAAADAVRKEKEKLQKQLGIKPTDSAASSGKKDEKPTWKAVADKNTNRTYYWNRKTKESAWIRPPDYDGPEEEMPDTPAPAAPQKSADETMEDFAKAFEERSKESAAAAASAAEGSREEARAEKKRPKRAWKEIEDPTTGRTYYFNRMTKVSTWEKPDDFEKPLDLSEPSEEAPREAKRPKIEQDESGGGAVSSTNEVKLERSTRPSEPSPWMQCTDPNTQKVYYFNQITKKSSWMPPADFVKQQLVKEEGVGEPKISSSNAPVRTDGDTGGVKKDPNEGEEHEKTGKRIKSEPREEDDDGVKDEVDSEDDDGGATGAGKKKKKKKNKRPVWRICYDEKREKSYYFNRKTGKSEWSRPPDFDGLEEGEKERKAEARERALEKAEDERMALENAQSAAIGGRTGEWEEVAPEESAFGGTRELDSSDDEKEEQMKRCADDDGADEEIGTFKERPSITLAEKTERKEYTFDDITALKQDMTSRRTIVPEDAQLHEKAMVMKDSLRRTSDEATFATRKFAANRGRRQRKKSDDSDSD